MMEFMRPQASDIVPMLRGLKHALKHGRDRFERDVPERLPGPALAVARVLLAGVDHLAQDVDRVAANVRHSLKAARPEERRDGAPVNPLAESFMQALAVSRQRIPLAEVALADNAQLKAAVVNTFAGGRALDAEGAARLTLSLFTARQEAAALAIFSAALSLLAEGNDETVPPSVLQAAAVDLGLALKADILRACAARDQAALAALYRKYQGHV